MLVLSRIGSRSAVLVALLGLTACSIQLRPRGTSYERTDFKLEIRSNTTWTALIDGSRSVDGDFNETLDLPDDEQPVCAVVTKTAADGYLRARVTPGGSWIETSEPEGSVAPCSSI